MREQSRINLPGFCVSKRIYASHSSVYAVLEPQNYKNTIRADQLLLSPVPRWKTERYACEMIYSTVSIRCSLFTVAAYNAKTHKRKNIFIRLSRESEKTKFLYKIYTTRKGV